MKSYIKLKLTIFLRSLRLQALLLPVGQVHVSWCAGRHEQPARQHQRLFCSHHNHHHNHCVRLGPLRCFQLWGECALSLWLHSSSGMREVWGRNLVRDLAKYCSPLASGHWHYLFVYIPNKSFVWACWALGPNKSSANAFRPNPQQPSAANHITKVGCWHIIYLFLFFLGVKNESVPRKLWRE